MGGEMLWSALLAGYPGMANFFAESTRRHICRVTAACALTEIKRP